MPGGVRKVRPAPFGSDGAYLMEKAGFILMQVSAMVFTVIAVFVLGVVFGAGVWVAWRGLDRRAGPIKSSGEPPDGQPQRQPNPLS